MIIKAAKYDILSIRQNKGRKNMQIGKISLHTAKSAEKTSSKSSALKKAGTNPFGVSFKGNVIQADVFQSSAKASKEGKGRLFASAVVSGINSFNEAFKARMNAIASFGKKITSSIFDTIEKIGNTEIKFNMEGIKNRLFPDREYNIKHLADKPVSELKTMWKTLAAAAA